jgi:precorrin-6y C5,15-methyltransferase (decarboxylating) CbiE subunit
MSLLKAYHIPYNEARSQLTTHNSQLITHLAAPKVQIIGIGDDGLEGLTAAARQVVQQAEVLIGARASLDGVPNSKTEKVEIGGDLDAIVRKLEAAAGKRVAILATGDPLFYGTARFLCDRLGKDRFEVTPHVSSMQLAFARVKESWDDANLTNLATQPLELSSRKPAQPPKSASSRPKRRRRKRSPRPCSTVRSTISRLTSARISVHRTSESPAAIWPKLPNRSSRRSM